MYKLNKPRILFVCPLPPPVHGSSMVSDAIRKSDLIQEEFSCDFVNLSTSRSMAEIGKGGIMLLTKKLWRFFGTYFAIIGHLIRHRYNLCYLAITCNGIGFLKDAPFVLLCKLFGCRVIIHQHNKGMDRFVNKPVYKQLLHLVYSNAKVILLSWNLYPDISKVVPRVHVMVCPNGIAELKYSRDNSYGMHKQYGLYEKDSSDNGPTLNTHSDTFEMLFLSNLIEGKGVWVVLDACKILKDKGYKFHCSFVGGVTKQISADIFVQAVCERELTGYIDYIGSKYGIEKEKFWKKADVFVFPTFYYNECFPLVVLEAMQHRVAVVSSMEGGIPDMLGKRSNNCLQDFQQTDCGFLVNADVLRQNSCNEMLASRATDEERAKSRCFNRERGQQTAVALEALILHPELCHTMGQAGYEKYQREFTDKVFENRLCECLRKACGA